MKTLSELISLSKREDCMLVEFLMGDKLDYHQSNLTGKVYTWIEDLTEDMQGVDFRLMDEQEYNDTILANEPSNKKADFYDWFGEENSKILVVLFYMED